MSTKRSVMATFHDKYPLVGPVFWALSLQYYITQYVVANGWRTPFSVRYNTISDLGNTVCGSYNYAYVCSPLHNYMNASFITLGLFMIAGSMLIYHEFRRSSLSFAGFTAMALAGVGTILVGLFPENTVAVLHVLGAALPFALGNVALLCLGSGLRLPKWLKVMTIAFGVVGLTGLILFMTKHYGWLGRGGMERVTAYPQSIWLILFGLYMSRNHYRHPPK